MEAICCAIPCDTVEGSVSLPGLANEITTGGEREEEEEEDEEEKSFEAEEIGFDEESAMLESDADDRE